MRPYHLSRFTYVLVILYATVCESQNGPLTVSGYVKDAATGRPIANAVVSAAGGTARSDEPTDIHGRFVLTLGRNVNRGDNIRIQVTKPGYDTYDEIVTVSNIALEFDLTPRLKPPKASKASPRHETPGASPTLNPSPTGQTAPLNVNGAFRLDSHITVTNARGEPVPDAHILLIAQNTNYVEGLSDGNGAVLLKSEIGVGPRTIFCAAQNFSAFLMPAYKGGERLVIKLRSRPHGGSVIILGSGEVPGLMGMLNPILDTLNRTYIYGSNLAIKGGKQQPVSFARNEPFEIEDNRGHHFRMTIVEIIGSSSLIDFENVTAN